MALTVVTLIGVANMKLQEQQQPLPRHPSALPPLQFNTACPGLFGSPAEFRKNFEHPILAGRDANATDTQLERVWGAGIWLCLRCQGPGHCHAGWLPHRAASALPCRLQGAAAQQALVSCAQQYMIRRTSETLKQYLPAKVQEVRLMDFGGACRVCCRLQWPCHHAAHTRSGSPPSRQTC